MHSTQPWCLPSKLTTCFAKRKPLAGGEGFSVLTSSNEAWMVRASELLPLVTTLGDRCITVEGAGHVAHHLARR